MKNLKNIARILFAIPFVFFGINHLIHAQQMQFYIPSFIPGGIFWIYFTGLAMIAACISIITEIMINLSSFLLAVMLLIFILTMHLPGMFNPQTLQSSMISLLKDFSLMSASLFIFANVKENNNK